MIKKSAIKDYVKKQGLRVSEDFYEAIEAKLERHIANAISRAKLNNRSTVKGKDV